MEISKGVSKDTFYSQKFVQSLLESQFDEKQQKVLFGINFQLKEQEKQIQTLKSKVYKQKTQNGKIRRQKTQTCLHAIGVSDEKKQIKHKLKHKRDQSPILEFAPKRLD